MRTPDRPRARGAARATTLALALLGLLGGGAAAAPPAAGTLAPAIDLPDLGGDRWSLEGERGRPVVLVFGELYHETTLRGCGDVRDAIGAAGFARDSIAAALVVAQDAEPGALRTRAVDARLPTLVLHDRARAAFGAYRVVVMPTVVVVDGEGRVVHAIVGRGPRLRETLVDALLVALGRLAPEDFAAALRAQIPGEDERTLRAARTVELARHLAHRGLDELAEAKLREALEIDPDGAAARVALGLLFLDRDRLPQAEEQFRAVLAHEPRSADARLGVAWVQLRRGGTELAEAESLLRELVATDPADPRAHHLLGLVHERLGRMADAAASFRTASELLMARVESWSVENRSTSDER